jgi:D-serine deaminase-like pyridoxal phosphate-dependent protein
VTAYERLEAALAGVEPPFAVVDLDALRDNADDLVRRAAGKPLRVASKLVRYEGHVAGVGDSPPNPLLGAAVHAMRRAAVGQLAERRAAVVAAVREVAEVPLVNGGGSGSIETTAAEPVVTEITAGSGLYAPALFDHYRAFRPRPAALFCLPVVRRPADGVATLLGGGYVASGPPGRDRLPRPHLPAGLRLTALEGAGEVQTPLVGRRRRAASRRPRLPAPREGRRAVRALRLAVAARGRAHRRRRADLPRRGQGVPVS